MSLILIAQQRISSVQFGYELLVDLGGFLTPQRRTVPGDAFMVADQLCILAKHTDYLAVQAGKPLLPIDL